MNSTFGSDYTKRFAAVLAIILAIRLISLWFNNSELFFDEAQYWFWSTQLEFGYFSKPPLLAWIISLSTSLCGDNGPFCIRLAAPLFHIATAGVIFATAQRMFEPRTAFWAGLTYAIMPAVSLSSTIISTDVPLLLCWSVTLYFYVRLQENYDWKWAIFLGIGIGFGLNAKYAMVYFLGCALVHMLIEQQEFTPPRKGGFWLAALVAAIMLVPNIVWNLQNGFVTISHTGDNIGWSGFDPNWKGVGEFFGSQFGVFGPIAFGVYLAAVFRLPSSSVSREHRLLLAFSLPIIVLILAQALISKAYANWAAPAYIAATILTAEVMVNRIPWGWMKSTVALHGFVFVAIAAAVCFAGPGQLVLPNGFEPFARTQGASLIAEEVEKELGNYPYNGLVTTDRKLSALMVYNLRNRDLSVHAWRQGDRARDHFELVVPFQESLRDPVLVVSRRNGIGNMGNEFQTVTPLGARQIAAGETRQVYLYRLEGHEKFR